MQPATAVIADLVAAVEPWDDLEHLHRTRTLAWLSTTDDIFRRIAPATPSRHLVAYTVLTDPDAPAIYLGLHRKSGLHLPMGGHVDPGEHPAAAARREAREEIGITPAFDVVGDNPFFLTVTTVTKPARHVDVSLWHVIRGSRTRSYPLDPGEFEGGEWWDLDSDDFPPSDPHLPRFTRKLAAALTRGGQ
ncbi:NUDIX domain-containing protein [Nocardia sp. ET3-3]|uniref:NUDIX domain-containing protein n=1 Tax=Nocardia terrae TaxID=2675851 RepID=A0A7K1UP72_9NOCA|nr:NUDIX domain-containing protein [Nocardia terrae]MVU75969.1 NUDIX domain-containing protein [Nocardia terrae]